MLSRNIRTMNLFMVRVNMLRRNIKIHESVSRFRVNMLSGYIKNHESV